MRNADRTTVKETLRHTLILPLAVGLAALLVFVLTLAPTVTSEDSGELIAAARHFGIPHPPGYPLWTILCGVFTYVIPFGSVAWRANLFSAVCGAAAAGILFLALRELKIAPLASAAAALCWVWSRWMWSQSVITEVYSLNAVVTAAMLWCILRWNNTQNPRLLVAGSLLVGLGMSNHHTIALAALAAVVFVVVRRPGILLQWRLVFVCIVSFAIGLLPYLYLPLRAGADPPINWGDPSNGQRFWEHVTRHQYGAVGPMKTESARSIGRFAEQARYFCTSMVDDLTWPVLAIALFGVGVAALRRRRLFLLVLLWLACTGLAFILLANYDLDRTSQWAMRVFFIPTWIGVILAFAIGVDTLLSWLRSPARIPKALSLTFVAIAAAAAPAWVLAKNWRQCDYSNYWWAYDHGVAQLACMDPNAMVFPSGDHDSFPLTYLVVVEGRRPDVLLADIYGYIMPKLCADRPPDSQLSPQAWLIRKERDRPVYFSTKTRPDVEPAGVLYRLTRGQRPTKRHAELLAACEYRNLSEPTVADFGADNILIDIAFHRGLAAIQENDQAKAIRHFESAAEHGRGIKEVFNNLGSATAEAGMNAEAIRFYTQAAKLDRRYTLPRWNLFRLYRASGDFDAAKDALESIVSAAPDDPRAHAELGFLLYEHYRDGPAAVREWNASLRLEPGQPQVIAALNHVYAETSRAPSATNTTPQGASQRP